MSNLNRHDGFISVLKFDCGAICNVLFKVFIFTWTMYTVFNPFITLNKEMILHRFCMCRSCCVFLDFFNGFYNAVKL